MEDSIALATTNSQEDITEIVLTSAAESGLQLSRLSRVDTLAMARVKCREITASAQGTAALAQAAQGALPAVVQSQATQAVKAATKAAQTQMVQEIAKKAPNGLFTATVSPEKLMRYNENGTFSSIVRGPGKGGRTVMKSHEGFKQVSLDTVQPGSVPAVNPVAVIGGAMQAMAMVSGQYYMHQLSTQLKSMGKQLDKLIENHNNEKIGVLRSVSVTIADLTSKKNPDAADLIRIQDAAVKAQEIFHEYLTRLDQINVEEIAGSKRAYLSEAEIKALRKRLDDSEIIFTMQVCFQASLLVEKCKAAEIAIRMRLNGYDARTAEDLSALVDGMNSTFHSGGKELCKEYLQPVLLQSQEYAEHGIDKKVQARAKARTANIQAGLQQALAAVENDKTAQRIKIAGIAKTGRETVEGRIAKTQQPKQPKKNLTNAIEQQMQLVEEAFQAQSKDSQTMITSIDKFFHAPRTLFYLPGNSGEERVFIVEESDTARAQ